MGKPKGRKNKHRSVTDMSDDRGRGDSRRGRPASSGGNKGFRDRVQARPDGRLVVSTARFSVCFDWNCFHSSHLFIIFSFFFLSFFQIRFMGKYNKNAFEKWLESEAEKQEKHIVIRSVCF